MKLDIERPEIQSSGLMQEHIFGIQDMGMIFDILRNKMYSNKIMAICKEISCNARDAHREIGKGDVPIEIYLPNGWDAKLKIKDFGPGISPDRMTNIFIKYAASTKRDDNLQTGGFGLGAKTPFSYSDTFSIITIVNGIEYHYAAFIDETKVGKLSLLEQKDAEGKPSGTEIIIPVKSQDFGEFYRCIEEVTRYWDLCKNSARPKIEGYKITYREMAPVTIEGNNWKLLSTSHYNLDVTLVIDGIIYSLDTSSFKKIKAWNDISGIRGTLLLPIDVGMVNLAANRESVHLDSKTETFIKNIFEEVSKDLSDKIKSKINSAKNYWEACEIYKNIYNTFYGYDLLYNQSIFTWNNLKLSDQGIALSEEHVKSYAMDNNRVEKRTFWSLKINNPEKEKIFYIDFNNFKEIPTSLIRKIFLQNKDIKRILIISKDTFEGSLKDYVKYIECKPLSEIISPPKNTSKRITYYLFDKNKNTFSRTSQEAIKDDKNKKVYVYFKKGSFGSEKIALIGKYRVPNATVHKLQEIFNDISIYGLEADVKNISKNDTTFDPTSVIKDAISLEEYIANNILNKISLAPERIKFAQYNSRSTYMNKFYCMDKIAEKLPKDSLINKYVEVSKNIANTLNEFSNISTIIEILPEDLKNKFNTAFKDKSAPSSHFDDLNAIGLYEKIIKTYPLLNYINFYVDKSVAFTIDYILMVDENLKKKEKVKNEQ